MRFRFLAIAASALAMAALALVIRISDDSHAPPPSPPLITSPSGPSSELRRKSYTKTGRGLVERLADDPQAALQWLLQESGPEERPRLGTDPHLQSAVIDAANRLVLRTHPQWGKDDPVVLENFVQLWAGADLNSAYDWVHQIPVGPVRERLMARTAFAASQSDPPSAAWLVVEEIPPGPIHEEAVVMVVHQWALQDPDSATAWVDQFPYNSIRDRARRELEGVISYRRASSAAP